MTNGTLELQWILVQQDGTGIPRFDPLTGDVKQMPANGVTGLKALILAPLSDDLAQKLVSKKIPAISVPYLPIHRVNLQPTDTVLSYISEEIRTSSHYECSNCHYCFTIDCSKCLDKTNCFFCPKCPQCGLTDSYYCSTCQKDIINPTIGPKKEPNCPNHNYPHGLNKESGSHRRTDVKYIDDYIILVKDGSGHDKFRITVKDHEVITDSL